MKSPLKYQSSEYDCVPTTFLNALNYLFEREEIPPEVIKAIMLYSLDTFDKSGEVGKNGTTRFAIEFLCNWLNYYNDAKGFAVECERLAGKAVALGHRSKIMKCLKNGGIVLARVYLSGWHYILVTESDEENISLFDPYYRKEKFSDEEVAIIEDRPFEMNRKVSKKRFESCEREYYALCDEGERECVLMHRKK